MSGAACKPCPMIVRHPPGALAGELTELVGRVPMKDIVSETTDLIEQLCIETALQMTQDNRAWLRSCWACRARACTSSCAATAGRP
jgi:hypothetical protein